MAEEATARAPQQTHESAPPQGFFTTLLSPLYSSQASLPSASPTTASPSSRTPHESASPASGPLTTAAASGADHRDANTTVARQKMGFLQSPFRSGSNSVVAAVEGQGGAVSTSSPASSAPSSAVRRGTTGNEVPAPQAEHTSAQQQQQQQQHGSGACAPHMLGYRQCLEVNPDFKTNCTWALDSYMRCKEDTEL